MNEEASEFVRDNLCCLKVLCDKSTAKRVVILLLRTASDALVKAVGELILNSREKIPKVVGEIFNNKKNTLRKKRLGLIKCWKLIAQKLAPLIYRLHGNEKTSTSARNAGTTAAKKVTTQDK